MTARKICCKRNWGWQWEHIIEAILNAHTNKGMLVKIARYEKAWSPIWWGTWRTYILGSLAYCNWHINVMQITPIKCHYSYYMPDKYVHRVVSHEGHFFFQKYCWILGTAPVMTSRFASSYLDCGCFRTQTQL